MMLEDGWIMPPGTIWAHLWILTSENTWTGATKNRKAFPFGPPFYMNNRECRTTYARPVVGGNRYCASALKKFYRAVSADKQHDNGKDTHNHTASLVTVDLQQISSIIRHCCIFGGFLTENITHMDQEDLDTFSGTAFCQFTAKSWCLIVKSCHEKEKAKTATKVMRLMQKPAPCRNEAQVLEYLHTNSNWSFQPISPQLTKQTQNAGGHHWHSVAFCLHLSSLCADVLYSTLFLLLHWDLIWSSGCNTNLSKDPKQNPYFQM